MGLFWPEKPEPAKAGKSRLFPPRETVKKAGFRRFRQTVGRCRSVFRRTREAPRNTLKYDIVQEPSCAACRRKEVTYCQLVRTSPWRPKEIGSRRKPALSGQKEPAFPAKSRLFSGQRKKPAFAGFRRLLPRGAQRKEGAGVSRLLLAKSRLFWPEKPAFGRKSRLLSGQKPALSGKEPAFLAKSRLFLWPKEAGVSRRKPAFT